MTLADAPRDRALSPRYLLLALWATLLLVAAVQAESLRDGLAVDNEARGRSLLLPLLDANLAFANATGLAQIGPQLERLRPWLDTSPVLWARAAGAPPPAGGAAWGTADSPAAPQATKPPQPSSDRAQKTKPRPRKILLVGASSAALHLGVAMERALERLNGIAVIRRAKIGSGLVRRDFYDWYTRLPSLRAAHRPDAVISMFGGNDCQDIKVGKRYLLFDSAPWRKAYRKRFLKFLGLMTGDFRHPAIVFGLPSMRSPTFSKKIARLNQLHAALCRQAGVPFIPLWDLSVDSKGHYRKALRFGGKSGLFRELDGIHLSQLGARYVAPQLLARMRKYWDLPTSVRATAPASVDGTALAWGATGAK